MAKTPNKPHLPTEKKAPTLMQSSHSEPEQLYPKQLPWVTDGCWKTGVAGVIAIVLLAYYYHAEKVLHEGLTIMGYMLTNTKHESIFAACIAVSLCMIIVETVRLYRFYGRHYIVVDPLLKSRQYSAFLLQAVKKYVLLLLLFLFTKFAYHNIPEYGFNNSAAFYQSWFNALEGLWQIFLFCGLPYIAITRAFRFNAQADQKDLATLTQRILLFVFQPLALRMGAERTQFTSNDKNALLGYMVKFFFCPVITLFFADNFSNLVNNFDYLFGGFIEHIKNGTYSMALFAADMGNVSTAFIFTIDVGLAWVGYVVSSRWLDNQTVTAEPTLLGWVVCLISYPPFRAVPGWLFIAPGEDLYKNLPSPNLVFIFGFMMIVSYFVYMLPTIWFGARFSNLTNRGIIRKGPFAIVRHPAYAAKNFAWWCVGFPTAIYTGFTIGATEGFLLFIGLICLTGVYYLRAITEERHLMPDPNYQEYCEQVRYRFIPKIY
jgi:protein-S-isoprenylcysteine O-methyltransferase Ste14